MVGGHKKGAKKNGGLPEIKEIIHISTNRKPRFFNFLDHKLY